MVSQPQQPDQAPAQVWMTRSSTLAARPLVKFDAGAGFDGPAFAVDHAFQADGIGDVTIFVSLNDDLEFSVHVLSSAPFNGPPSRNNPIHIRRPVVEHHRVQVSPIRPDERTEVGV